MIYLFALPTATPAWRGRHGDACGCSSGQRVKAFQAANPGTSVVKAEFIAMRLATPCGPDAVFAAQKDLLLTKQFVPHTRGMGKARNGPGAHNAGPCRAIVTRPIAERRDTAPVPARFPLTRRSLHTSV